MQISRRAFVRLAAGTGAAAAFGQLNRSAVMAAPAGGYRAMVGVFLFGGNDGWNMVVPTDGRYSGYAASRGTVGIGSGSLTPLTGLPFALHPAMGALRPLWDEGALSLVVNAGTLHTPLTRDLYKAHPELRPTNLMSHGDEQAHWQGLHARDTNVTGFMGRLADRGAKTPTPSLISFSGSNLAVLGNLSSPLILPSQGTLDRNGYKGSGNAANAAKNAAIDAFAGATGYGPLADTVNRNVTDSYAMAVAANGVLTGSSSVDNYFVDPVTGGRLNSEISRQLLRVARMIEARGLLGHDRQTFFVGQGNYDTHAFQVGGADRAGGDHANMLGDLAKALAGFHRAMQGLGLAENVTAFTMSDFGRTYQGNAQGGTDHAWGSNHLVVGGALAGRGVYGNYPDPTLGGRDDIDDEGRFVPTIAQEEYLGAIARWHGVSDGDMPYVLPNWATWTSNGRGPLPLFRS